MTAKVLGIAYLFVQACVFAYLVCMTFSMPLLEPIRFCRPLLITHTWYQVHLLRVWS